MGQGIETPFGIRSYTRPGLEQRGITSTSPAGQMPTSVANRLLMHLVQQSALLAAGATVINSQTGEDLLIPTSTAHSTSLQTGEAAALTASDPTYLSRTLKRYKYGFLLQVSNEALRDAGFDIEGYLAEQAAESLAQAWGRGCRDWQRVQQADRTDEQHHGGGDRRDRPGRRLRPADVRGRVRRRLSGRPDGGGGRAIHSQAFLRVDHARDHPQYGSQAA
jgi:hypothetical protein